MEIFDAVICILVCLPRDSKHVAIYSLSLHNAVVGR